jgi:hypothetical protein
MKTLKNKYIYAILVMATITMNSCNFTEPDMLTFKSEEEVTKNLNSLTTVINNVYAYLPDGYDRIGGSMLSSACDEAEEVNDLESIQNFNTGNWGLFSNPEGNPWTNNYNGIRKANVFLDLLTKVDWTYLQKGNAAEYARRVKITKMHKYEAHFLRAFFYFELIKRYGGVPLITRSYDPNTELDSLKVIPRAEFGQCVDYIAAQCDSAAKYLDTDYSVASSQYVGRATKGAALALKARTLLYAASDLYNQTANTDSLIGYTDANRKVRWIRAAKACKAVMDMVPTTYGTHNDYSGLFLLRDAVSKEVIFEKRYTVGNGFEVLNYPVGIASGKTSTCPSQNLVDAYEMKFFSASDSRNGKSWDELGSGYNPLAPYANRDPRLKKTIVCNTEKFGKDNTVIQIWEGGNQGIPRKYASKTGYYLRKYVDESLDLTSASSNTIKHQWIYFRLSEVNLNYAEAMIEAFGSPTATSPADGLTVTALTALNNVRTRPAVGMPALPTTITTENFKLKVRNERRVELAFEDHRYWDARRWEIADLAIGGEIYGMRIENTTPVTTPPTTTLTFKYTKQLVEKRTWNDKMYFYPIPQSEMNKSTAMKQNPGWE